MVKTPVILLPGGVLPAEFAYGDLIEQLGDDGDDRAKDLEVYEANTPPPGYGLHTEAKSLSGRDGVASVRADPRPGRLTGRPVWFVSSGRSMGAARCTSDGTSSAPASCAARRCWEREVTGEALPTQAGRSPARD